jgi:chromosome segregation ATPase
METGEGMFHDRAAALADELGAIKLDLADMMRQRDNLRVQLEAAKVSIQDLHRFLMAERNLARLNAQAWREVSQRSEALEAERDELQEGLNRLTMHAPSLAMRQAVTGGEGPVFFEALEPGKLAGKGPSAGTLESAA